MIKLFCCNIGSKIFRSLPVVACSRFRHKSEVKAVCPEKPKPLIKLDCKVALITGGSDGIGHAVAQQLLSENARSVVLVGICNNRGRESVQLLNNTFGKNKAIFMKCDVQSGLEVEDCYLKVIKEYGTLDIVVNAAGILNESDWEKEVMTNFVGTINNMIEAYKLMSKECNGKGGVILNFSGMSGVHPFHPAPVLAASYHGIVGLSRSFGDDVNFKSTGVRVVCLCPGVTNTNFIKNAEKRALNERMGTQLGIMLNKLKRQKAVACAQSAVHVLKYGSTGSIWAVDGSKLYSLPIPDWKQYRILESQLL